MTPFFHVSTVHTVGIVTKTDKYQITECSPKSHWIDPDECYISNQSSGRSPLNVSQCLRGGNVPAVRRMNPSYSRPKCHRARSPGVGVIPRCDVSKCKYRGRISDLFPKPGALKQSVVKGDWLEVQGSRLLESMSLHYMVA
jgi:hypothetical protein